MPLRLIFRRDARTEFRQAVRYYEQARVGLGEQFRSAVQTTLDRIIQMPERFTPVHADVRRALVPHFPYAVFFRAYADRIRVISVFHTSRDPAVWQQRADEEAN